MQGSERVSGVAVMVALGCLGSLGNLLVFVVFSTRLVTGIETEYGNFAILSLAVTGLLISSFFSTLAAVSSLSTTFTAGLSPGSGLVPESVCQFTGWMHVMCYMSTLLSVMCMAIHRYLAILNPVNYKTVLSKARCVVATGFIWAFSACWTSFPFFGWGHYNSAPKWEVPLCLLHYSKSKSYVLVTAFGTSLVPIFVTAICFWKCIKRLRSTAPAGMDFLSRPDESIASEDPETDVGSTCARHNAWTSTQWALLKADILITVTFAVLNLPLSIIVSLPASCHNSFLYWAIIIGSANFSIQWVFICMYNNEFVQTKTWLMAKICGRNQDSNIQ